MPSAWPQQQPAGLLLDDAGLDVGKGGQLRRQGQTGRPAADDQDIDLRPEQARALLMRRYRSAGSAISGSPGSNPFRWNCIEIRPVSDDRRAPLMADLRRTTQRAQAMQNGRLREIVAQEDVDVDPLLVGHDGIAPAMGEQDARRGARLVAGSWLMIASITPRSRKARVCTVSSWAIQTTSRARPDCLQRGGDAAVAGADAVEADEVGLARQQRAVSDAGALAVVAAFDAGKRRQVGIFAGQDLVEAELPLGMIAQRPASPR